MSLRLRSTLVVAAVSGLLFGCATSQKIQVVQPGDQNLSCRAITEELAKLDKTQAEIDSKKRGNRNQRWGGTFLASRFGLHLL